LANTNNGQVSKMLFFSYSHVRSIKNQGPFGSSFSLHGRIAVESIKEINLVRREVSNFHSSKYWNFISVHLNICVPLLEST
jgi:hypothetical protein